MAWSMLVCGGESDPSSDAKIVYILCGESIARKLARLLPSRGLDDGRDEIVRPRVEVGWFVKAYRHSWGVEDGTRGIEQQFALEFFWYEVGGAFGGCSG